MPFEKAKVRFGGVSVLEKGNELQLHFTVPAEYKPEYLLTQAGLSRVIHIGLRKDKKFGTVRAPLVFELREAKG